MSSKKIATVLIACLVFAGIAATAVGQAVNHGLLPTANASIKLGKEQKQALDAAGFTSELDIGETTRIADTNTCFTPIKQCLDENCETTSINTTVKYSCQENFEAKRNQAIKARLAGIANAEVKRQAQKEAVVGEGRATITEKK
jgi:hypothetical protein